VGLLSVLVALQFPKQIGTVTDSHLFIDFPAGEGSVVGMPRMARIVIPGQPHHVVQRGHNRQDVFFIDDDRRTYLEFLREHDERLSDTIS